MLPRAVVVERATEFRDLLARHGTRQQAGFFLEQRGQDIREVEERHLRYEETRAAVLGAVPADWRTAAIERGDLDRFLFSPDDVVLVLGQDGLVANVAKYLDGQPVLGLDPEPGRNPGVLVPHDPAATADLCADLLAGRARDEHRTMVEATLDDGQRLLALNEVFVGHETHQSARYAISDGATTEEQSSSGVIVATGTGATGWASSINGALRHPLGLPGPTDDTLAWFVREAWAGPATATGMTAGLLDAGAALTLTCRLPEGGVLFGDGIEGDRLRLDWGQRVRVTRATARLRLVR